MILQTMNLSTLNDFQIFVDRCPPNPSDSRKFRGGQFSVLIGRIELQKCGWNLICRCAGPPNGRPFSLGVLHAGLDPGIYHR